METKLHSVHSNGNQITQCTKQWKPNYTVYIAMETKLHSVHSNGNQITQCTKQWKPSFPIRDTSVTGVQTCALPI